MATLTPGQVKWLRTGDRGVSSEALFETLTGHILSRNPDLSSHPRDGGDFARCVQMLRTCGLQDRIGEMAARSPEWAALVAIWPALTAKLDDLAGEGPGFNRSRVLATFGDIFRDMRAVLQPITEAREAKKEKA